ncbi:hypothetical protein HpCOL199_10960 [Helicobacter pylori]
MATTKGFINKAKPLKFLTCNPIRPCLYQNAGKPNNTEGVFFFELGCGSVLKGLNKRLSNKPTISVGDNKGLDEAIEFLEEYV